MNICFSALLIYVAHAFCSFSGGVTKATNVMTTIECRVGHWMAGVGNSHCRTGLVEDFLLGRVAMRVDSRCIAGSATEDSIA